MRNGNERNPSSSSASSSSLRLDCEVVELGLKMPKQPTHSYSCDGELFFSSPCVDTIYHLPATPSEGCGKALFTDKQWEELERQKKIHKYIAASMPVPPQLLLPTSTSPHPSSISQSAGVDLRFSTSGSDPEPWRCKRTDGKKWRCSRDVAGDHKYCERHAHKTKPRSRKLVELSSHKPYFLPPSSTSFDHTRCMEWLRRGKSNDNNWVAARKEEEEEWEQVMHISSKKKVAVYDLEEKQGSYMSMNPYIPDTSYLELKSLQEANLSSNFTSNSPPPSSSSLTLSMCGGNDKENGELNIGVMNPVSWMNMNMSMSSNSAPGGPLGEALCLGNASVTRGCGDALNFIG